MEVLFWRNEEWLEIATTLNADFNWTTLKRSHSCYETETEAWNEAQQIADFLWTQSKKCY
jgi:hypothetical protein